jgi:hypothetical protein
MKIPSSKAFVLIGFAISLASVVLNTFVLSSINSRLRAVESEYFELEEALSKQVSQLNEADLKFDLYRVMHNLAFSSPDARAQDARDDARAILQGFLVKFYAAANDISPIDVTRVAVDEAGDVIPKLGKMLELLQALQQSADQAERARLASELAKLEKEESTPKSELAKKLREVGKYADAEAAATNEIELMSKLFPIMKLFKEQIVESIKRKENRMRELEGERASLAKRAAYATYAAISLQLFGLMFILAKDIANDIVEGK